MADFCFIFHNRKVSFNVRFREFIMRCKRGASFDSITGFQGNFLSVTNSNSPNALTLSDAENMYESASVENLWISYTILADSINATQKKSEKNETRGKILMYAILRQSQRNKHKFYAIIMFLMGCFVFAPFASETRKNGKKKFIGIYGTSSGEGENITQ